MKKKRTVTAEKATAAAVIGHIFWGLSFMASRTALNTAPVILLLSHRFLLAFCLMSLMLLTPLADLHLKKKSLKPLLLLGLLEPVIYFFGEQYGLLHSSTIFSGVMIALIPIVSTMMAIPVLGERPTLQQILCSVMSVAGVIGIGMLTNSSGSLDWIGIAGLLTAVMSAVAYMLLNRGIASAYTPFERTYFMLGFGALVFTILAVFLVKGEAFAYFSPLLQPGYLLSVAFLAVGCSVIAYFLSSYAITGLPVAQATVFANLTTAVSVLAGILFLHEPFSFFGLLCCAVILLGIYGVQRGAKPQKKPETVE